MTAQQEIKSLLSSRLSAVIFFILAVFLPVFLPIVRRTGPVVFVLSALLVLVYVARQNKWREAFDRISQVPLLLGTCFLVWAAVTCFWTPGPFRGWHSVGSGALIYVSALCLNTAPIERPKNADLYMALAIMLAALIIIVDLKTGEPLLRLTNSRPEPYRYNMVVVSLVALSFGLFHQGVNFTNPIKYMSLICLFIAAFVSESETAKLALLLGYLVFFLSPLVPHFLSLLCFICAVVVAWILFLASPDVFGELAKMWPTLAEHGHAVERLQIWGAYSRFAFAGLPWGWGAEAVAYVPMTSYFNDIAEVTKPWLVWLHPHNNIIQIAAEMGWPGIVMGLMSCFALVLWAHKDERLRSARSALVTTVLVVSLISHGFWQMWWWSVVAACFYCLSNQQNS